MKHQPSLSTVHSAKSIGHGNEMAAIKCRSTVSGISIPGLAIWGAAMETASKSSELPTPVGDWYGLH